MAAWGCVVVGLGVLRLSLSVCVVESEPMRRIEIWVDDTHWTLTHSDGQLRLADITITNFSYNRMTFTDDSGEHRLELGAFRVQNLMPNLPQVYQVKGEM